MCTCTELVLTSPLCSWCVCVWLWSVRYKQHGDLLVTTLLHSAASVPIPPPQGTFNMLIEIWLKGYSCIKYKILSPEGLKRMIPHLFHPHEKSFVYIWYFPLYRISQKGGFMWNVQMCVISPFTVHDCYSMFCLVKVRRAAKRAENRWSEGHQRLCYWSLSVAGMTSTPSLFRAFCLVLCLAPGSNGNQKGHGGRSQSSALMTLAPRQTDSVHPIRRPPDAVSSPYAEPLPSLFGELPFSRSLWFPSQETTKSFSHRHAH